MRLPSCIDVHHNSAPEAHPRLAWRTVGGSEAACNGSNGSAQTPSVLFPFFKGVRRHRCSCCRGAGLLVCVGGAKAAWTTSPGRVWWRFALALAPRATARRTSQAAGRAAASGLRRWPIYDNGVLPCRSVRRALQGRETAPGGKCRVQDESRAVRAILNGDIEVQNGNPG